jgi:hypothetical protein
MLNLLKLGLVYLYKHKSYVGTDVFYIHVGNSVCLFDKISEHDLHASLSFSKISSI